MAGQGTSPKRDRSLLAVILTGGIALGLALAAIIPGVSTVVRANAYRPLDVGALRDLAQRSTIYDAGGGVISVLGTQNREAAKLSEVPKVLQNAVIAVEDRSFWTNGGIDVKGMARAAVNNLTSDEVQGGSTITQQLVKNRILTPKRDLRRKMSEMVLAMRLDDIYTKKQILEQYLNTVYFGQGSYGVKAAAERFFLAWEKGSPYPRGKRLDELTIGDAAMLAGLISNPEGDNPFVAPDRAKARRALVLQLMVDQEYITQEQADAANKEGLPWIKPPAELRPRNAWAEEVQDRLFHDPMYKALGDTVKERRRLVLEGGLKIQATLDRKVDNAATAAINEILPENPGFTGALVAMDPRNGYVKAMVAGPGFKTSQYNIATSYPGRQAGSTWKVITLATALELGFSPDDRVSGSSPCEFEEWGKTQNAEGGGGTMTIRAATQNSVNCAFARIELAAGFHTIIPTAWKMGITQKTLRPILSMTLGTIESTPLEMATVASTIANGGTHHSPVFASKITAPDGRVLFDAEQIKGERAISPETSACEIDLLRGVVTGGTGTAARLNDRPVFGKTGTTDLKTDANFLGATPQLAAFIWHGNINAQVPGAGFGGQIPARIFKQFMETALEGQPVLDFPPPGPACDREGMFISEKGRSDKPPPGLAPKVQATTTVPPPAPAPVVTVPATSPPTTVVGGSG